MCTEPKLLVSDDEEITPEMLEAGFQEIWNYSLDIGDLKEGVIRVYRAMRAARRAIQNTLSSQSERTELPSPPPHPAAS